ncbi:IucA/IucC family protein [Kushneria sp. Sum13]|uniref:IucA/IucC family protein n=1 Tax=Kushneria sp. Sum13 TaxID=3459196 RepID=UPI004045FFCE
MNVRPYDPAGIISEQASLQALLNCLIREIAIPRGWLTHEWPAGSEVPALDAPASAIPLWLRWPEGLSCLVLVDRISAQGIHRYLLRPWLRVSPDQPWQVPGYLALARAMVMPLAREQGTSLEALLAQMQQSLGVMTELVSARHGEGAAPLQDYIESEQSLWFGHSAHPAPKARQWPDGCRADDYVPERRCRTRMHQWAVPRQGLCVQSATLAEQQVLDSVGDQRLAGDGEAVLSMHPIQARLFAEHPAVQALLAQGVIRDLGESGFEAWPTASLRTWYVENHPFFIKGSLNVRVTNCVRKNAWYELDSTGVIDAVMGRILALNEPQLARLRLAREPASVSWAPPDTDIEQQRWLTEQTGIVLRENFCQTASPSRCVLAASLFGRSTVLQPMISDLIGEADRKAWFTAYLEALLMPVLALYFRHGVVLEPHLQNCVLIHDDGWPAEVLLRDFEGVKLIEGSRWLEDDLSDAVRRSLTYSRAQGWQRIVYCLLINHLGEAVLALSWDDPALGEALWAQLHRSLQNVSDRLGVDAPELAALLSGAPLQCKTNLLVRLRAAADREAGYVSLPGFWRQEVACA